MANGKTPTPADLYRADPSGRLAPARPPSENAKVVLRGRFPAGQKVSLYPGDSPNTAAVKTATTDKHSVTEFAGLTEGEVFFAGAEIDGEWRSAQVTAKVAADTTKAEPVALPSPAPGGPDPTRQIVTGSRSTADVPTLAGGSFSSSAAGKPTPKGEQVDEPQPHPRQEDVKGEPQRSDTVTGEATPKEKDELQPAPSQEDLREGRIEGVKKDAPQRSATEAGEATPKDPDERQPSLKQEDVPKGTEQRSDTETGEAEPKPAAKGADQRKRVDSSVEHAKGRTRAKPREKTSKSGAKAAPSSTKRQAKSRKK